MQWYLSCLMLILVCSLGGSVEGYKIRFGRERSRILKLRKRKSAFVDRLNLLTKTRGIGIFTLQAVPEDAEQESDVAKIPKDPDSFAEYLPKKILRTEKATEEPLHCTRPK